MTRCRSSLARSMCLALAWLACLPAAGWSGEAPQLSAAVDFEKQIGPIFASRCVECHGAENQEGGLRLDHRIPALRGGDSGKVIVAGDSGASPLFRRVSSADEAERMPPADGEHEPLTPAQIAAIKHWIDAGAAWPEEGRSFRVKSDHWAYQPVRREMPAPVPGSEWCRNPLDLFVLARLHSAGVTPSPEAERHTLVRRLHHDLAGLPPRPEDVDDFVQDASPARLEKVVDRLLASPRFGERWGRHWLDKARYADSDGYEKDNPRPDAWRYRDWVIEGINFDLPFDRFTIEQLAGDLLPDAGPEQKLATAFHRQTLTNTEGGVDQEQFRVEAIFDRVNTTSTVWLGLTVGCAQCHTHKYDQITQSEYFQLFAFFNNGDETTVEVPVSDVAVAEYERARAGWDARVAALQAQLEVRRAELAPGFQAWEAQLQARLAAEAEQVVRFHPLEVLSVKSTGGATFEQRDDGSWLAGGRNPARAVYRIRARSGLPNITGFKLEVLADPSLPAQGPGRVAHGNFVLSEFAASAAPAGDRQQALPVAFSSATADFAQNGFPPERAIDADDQTGWAVAPQFGRNHEAVFVTNGPLNPAGESTQLEFVLTQNHGTRHTIGRFRLLARTGTKEDDLPESIREALAVSPDRRAAAQKAALLEYFAARDADYARLNAKLADLRKNAPPRPVMGVRVIGQRVQDPRTTRLLRRGDFLQPLDPVEPGTLAVLHEFEPRRSDAAPDRLDLARWLVDRDNPLTPRVAVNQVWSHLFGRGLVRTMNDFGVRGDPPTHPELLDWLAAELVGDRGSRIEDRDGHHSPLTAHHSPGRGHGAWSRKRLIRLIVTSDAYRQSSHHRPELAEIDPQNALLHRQNRYRVEAEAIRDISLAASGLLSQKIGGPSVFPPLPSDIAALSYAGNFKWTDSTGDDRYRRGMYTFFKRTAPHPNLMTFDCPDANTTAIQRSISNTPLMALTTLNNVVFVEASQALAKRLLEDPKVTTDAERLERAFRLCIARQPSPEEADKFQELLAAAREWYAAQPESARKLAGDVRSGDVPEAEAAAWVSVLRVTMNLDEFVTRE